MKPIMRLTLLACGLGTASVAIAQTADIPPPNDVIRLPGSVTTPTMPVVVLPRDGLAPPLVRSLGADSTLSDDDTLIDGAATGGGETSKKAATTGQMGIFDSGDKPSNNAGSAAATDTSADSGANSGTGDASNMADQNKQPDNSTIVPGGVPQTNAPANASGASSGK